MRTTMMNTMLSALVLTVAGSLSLSSAAAAMTPAQDSPPAKKDDPKQAQQEKSDEAPPKDILSGPEVIEDEAEAPPRGDFANIFTNPRRDRPEVVVPAERWMRMVLELELSEEQRIEIEQVGLDFRREVLEHREAHAEELRELNRQSQAANREGREVPAEVIRKTRQILSQAPSIQTSQERIWEILSHEQQEVMKEALAAERERMVEQMRQRREAAGQQTDEMTPPMRGEGMEVREAEGGMMMEGGEGMARDGDRARRRDLAAGFGRDGLDRAGERRLRFLRQLQKVRPAGAPPSDEEMTFEFDSADDSGEEAGADEATSEGGGGEDDQSKSRND